MTLRFARISAAALALSLIAAAPALACPASVTTRVLGDDNAIDVAARNCAQVDDRIYGDANELALRAQTGGRIRSQVVGDGNSVRASAD